MQLSRKEIVTVTAFFDIGREKFGAFARSADTYIEYFRFWAGMKNRMIIFCQPQYADAVLAVRRDYGLEDRTEMITVENIYDIEPGLFGRMKKIERDIAFLKFRSYSAPENRADYSYVVMLKAWCLDI